jgi:transposase
VLETRNEANCGKEKATKLVAAAVPLLTQYTLIQQELEQLMQQMKTYSKKYLALKISIPGVGLVTVAGFIAEVGNIEDYNHPRQIQKLAGLNLKENSSGKHREQT